VIRKVDSSGIITSIAGTGGFPTGGDGGPAVNATFGNIRGLATDANDNLYLVDNNRVRRIDASGTITTIAGADNAGFAGDGGPATAALLNYPVGLATDSAGTVYIADQNNYRVRRIKPSGIITTLAGSSEGFSGDGGPPAAAQFFYPSSLATDSAGSLYVGDWYAGRVRKITQPAL